MTEQPTPPPPDQDPLDLDSSVSDWAMEFPKAIVLFESLGIDYCCGGKSLRYECLRQQQDPDQVLQQLDRLRRQQDGPA